MPDDLGRTLAGSGGGGGAPEWVPANAKIYIDLVNDRAWTEADGEVAISALLGADANTVNGWGTTDYNPSDLTADGLVYTVNPPAVIGAALTALLAGATISYKYKAMDGTGHGSNLALLTTDGNDAIDVEVVNTTGVLHVYTWGGTSADHGALGNIGVDALNSIAATITASRFEVAANGSSVFTNSDDHPDVAAALIDLGPGFSALQYITIYDALPSTTGLSALSQTGVANTAPMITNDPGDFAPTFTEAAAVNGSTVATVTTADAEGNPLVFSLPVNVGSKFAVDASGIVTSTEDLLAAGSPYTFTLRATDPGGLYVEQEFTITVTA